MNIKINYKDNMSNNVIFIIEFENYEDAEYAFGELYGRELDRKPLDVSISDKGDPKNILTIEGLSRNISTRDIEYLFGRREGLIDIRKVDIETGNTFYVEFRNPRDAENALKSLNEKKVRGIPIRIEKHKRDEHILVVSGLSDYVTEEDVNSLFSRYG